MGAHDIDLGWQWGSAADALPASLPSAFYTRCAPVPVAAPRMVLWNADLAADLGLMAEAQDYTAQLSGNEVPHGCAPVALAYAGHQFGHLTMLGDGRAHLLGEHIAANDAGGARFDVQLKGSGATPYSRGGDGRAALAPMLREYIMSEAMAALGIATTRGLAVVATGEPVFRETALAGAVLTRIATSHLRVGNFEYAASLRDDDALRALADYAIQRHYSSLLAGADIYLNFLRAVMARQIALVVQWWRVGFIHGVMNTDNTTISGETIDYGPCAFMDDYDAARVFSSIDSGGRYAFARQPQIVQWNMTRLAEALLPLIDDDRARAAGRAQEVIGEFDAAFGAAWLACMRAKLGLDGAEAGDVALAHDFLTQMQERGGDYTNCFRALAAGEAEDLEDAGSGDWQARWQARRGRNKQSPAAAAACMRAANPARIPRNHQVEAALEAAVSGGSAGDLERAHTLLAACAAPYDDDARFTDFCVPPREDQRVLQTFCGT